MGGGCDGVCIIGLRTFLSLPLLLMGFLTQPQQGLGRVEWFVFTTLSLPFAQGELHFVSKVIPWIEDLSGGWDYCCTAMQFGDVMFLDNCQLTKPK